MATERKQEFKVDGKDLVDQIKQIIEEGNTRRIIIKNKTDKTLIEIPLTVGVIGAVLVTECTITVIRDEPDTK
jgi:ribosomal 30S subunit maturation factor RimM